MKSHTQDNNLQDFKVSDIKIGRVSKKPKYRIIDSSLEILGIFKEMKARKELPDDKSFSQVITALKSLGRTNEAIELFDFFQKNVDSSIRHEVIGASSHNAVLRAICKKIKDEKNSNKELVGRAEQIWSDCDKSNFIKNTDRDYLLGSMLRLYSACKNPEENAAFYVQYKSKEWISFQTIYSLIDMDMLDEAEECIGNEIKKYENNNNIIDFEFMQNAFNQLIARHIINYTLSDDISGKKYKVAELYRNLGCAYAKWFFFREAFQCYQNGLGLVPDNINIYLAWGAGLEQLGHYQEAIEKFIMVANILELPYHGDACIHLGDYYRELKAYNFAERCYLKVATHENLALRSLAYCKLGKLYLLLLTKSNTFISEDNLYFQLSEHYFAESLTSENPQEELLKEAATGLLELDGLRTQHNKQAESKCSDNESGSQVEAGFFGLRYTALQLQTQQHNGVLEAAPFASPSL